MLTALTSFTDRHPARATALAAGGIALVVLSAAFVFQYGFGYAPCPLCLQQRWPYYLGIPFAFLLAILAPRLPPATMLLGFFVLAGLFVWGLSLGVYQSGAEWGFWQGPRDCSAGNSGEIPASVGGLLDAIQKSTVVSCTDPRFRFLGLSFAGWNAVVMAGLIGIVLAGARKVWRRHA